MRIFSSTLTGLAAVALVGATDVISAQQPVRVRKEAGGQVVIRDTVVRVDTVTVTRVDTVTVDRVVTRIDTVTVTQIDTVFRVRDFSLNGFYWGVAGGGVFPADNLDEGFNTGWNASLLAGWRVGASPWGIRLDAVYNQLNGDEIGGFEVDGASVWGAMLDATFEIPPAMSFGSSGLYLLGGIGVHRLDDFDFDEEDFDIDGDAEIDEPEFLTESSTEFGVNAGLGFRFGFGRTSLLLEGRWVNMFTEGSDSNYFPVTIGFTF